LKKVLLAALCLVAVAGCGGSSSSGVNRTVAGKYSAQWVNVDDATDFGSSEWIIDADGSVAGTDIDVSHEFNYTVFGTIDASGNLDATTSLVGGDEVIPLTGRLQFDSAGKLSGDLHWASTPPTTYTYTFTRLP